MSDVLLIILIVWCFTTLIVGAFGYTSLKLHWGHIISVGASYLILCGVMSIVILIRGLFRFITTGSLGEDGIAGIIVCLIFAVIAVFLYIRAFSCCETVSQRILLPFVAFFLAFGWTIRFVLSFITHVPVDAGYEKKLAEQEAKQQAQQRDLEERRQAAKEAAMQQFGVSGSEVKVNSTGDMVQINDGSWIPVHIK